MPELPEVEITKRAIAPFLEGRRVSAVTVRVARLRLPLPSGNLENLPGQSIQGIERRAKYLLMRASRGTLILHLGMSGSLAVISSAVPPGKHDHLDIVLENKLALRFRDPRRFGSVLWSDEDPLSHPLLRGLGPEPLGDCFTGEYLFSKSRGRRVTVKQFIMDSHVVAGIGNIYANEALFHAGINPATAAGNIPPDRCRLLAESIREVLSMAIARGEKYLADNKGAMENPAHFPLDTDAYGKEGEPCPQCGKAISMLRQGGRSTFCCEHCQK